MITARNKVLPLPLRAWAAKRTKVGGRDFVPHLPLPPTLVRFAAQALKGRGSAFPMPGNLRGFIQAAPAAGRLARWK